MSAKKNSFYTRLPLWIQHFLHLLQNIWSDVVYVYKRFFSWNLTKLSFLGVSFFYGILAFIPFILLMLLVGWIDSINWLEVLQTGNFLGIIQDPNQVFWSLGMMGIFALGFGVFFLVTSYYIIFIIKMYRAYILRETHSIRSSISFGARDFLTFINISVINFLIIFFPVVLWMILATILGSILGSLTGFTLYIMRFLQLAVILFVVYLAYKTQFSYVIFAGKKEKKSALKIVKKSWKRAKARYFLSFIGIALIYFLIQMPFQSVDTIMQNRVRENTLIYNYKNDLLSDLSESDTQYLEFIAQDYKGVSSDQMLQNIRSLYNLRILHFIIMYFLFGSLYILLVTSFYLHALKSEKK